MSVTLKPIDQQVIFITGASRGVGLALVHLALNRGAKVFMVGPNENELQHIQDEMRFKNLPSAYAVADMAEIDQLQIAADQCSATFGTIDTWVNAASISLYSRIIETDQEEARRLFDTNFWGTVNGSIVAAMALKNSGGALINLGSTHSGKSIPVQGIYCASKEAVRGFTNSFREELALEKYPISVSLILPEGLDRVYLPEVVAEQILTCASHVTKEIGVSGKFNFPKLKKALSFQRREEVEILKPAMNYFNEFATYVKRKRTG
jgi:short-subunit dehydrogenase